MEIALSRVRLNTERLYTAIVRDIRERRAQHRSLQHQATHDSLTSLPNRGALLAHLERVLAPDRSQPSIALLMLDLCRFKEVNDTLGHNVGDRVLCEVAFRFRQALGESGFIARIGGDEFTVVVDRPHSAETVVNTSQALIDSLRAPIDVAGISIEVGVSIGIARFPQDASGRRLCCGTPTSPCTWPSVVALPTSTTTPHTMKTACANLRSAASSVRRLPTASSSCISSRR